MVNLNQKTCLGEKENRAGLFFREIDFLIYATHYKTKTPSVNIYFFILKTSLKILDESMLQTVIEHAEFIKKADKIFGADERGEIVEFLSENPKAGKELENFGGIRKMQWKDFAEYNIYFHPGTRNLPLVVIAIFKKGEKLISDKIIEILIYKEM